MQEEVVKAYYAQVPGTRFDQTEEAYVIPCDARLPRLDIFIGNSYTAIVPGNLIRGPPLNDGSRSHRFF